MYLTKFSLPSPNPVCTLESRPARSTCRTLFILLATGMFASSAQCNAEMSVDWLYDFRHTTDPKDNANNFPAINLKLFVPQSFGSFLMQEELSLNGTSHNASESYTEISQSIRINDSAMKQYPLFIHIGYSGGLGNFNNATGSYYLQNAYNLGLETSFQPHNIFCNVFLAMRYTNFSKPSYDPMLSIYAGKYFFNYKLLVANSLEGWTTSNDQGTDSTHGRTGKYVSWDLKSEIWYKTAKNFSVGMYIRTTRNVYVTTTHWLLYPSTGVRYSF